MSVALIQERLKEYQYKTTSEEENAIKEIMQEICLAGLSRAGFFKEAVFQGGTCLRIVHGLQRFSEDLDFVLKKENSSFTMAHFLNHLKGELNAYGFSFELQDRSQANEVVKKAFLKDDSWGRVLVLQYQPPQSSHSPKKIKIKIEVDSNPPKGGINEEKVLNFPFPFSIITQDLSSLFAGKSHALLCRPYVKGRDWYDFLWYARKKVKLNYNFLENALFQAGPWKDKEIRVDSNWYKKAMENQIKKIKWKELGLDIQKFIRANEIPSLSYWTEEFFLNELTKLLT